MTPIQLRSSGRLLNAKVHASESATHIDIIVESRSGARSSDRERNPDYLPALTSLLEQLALLEATIVDLQIVSRPALARSEIERRLPFDFPIGLSRRTNVEALRSRITEAQRGVARGLKVASSGGGNNNKGLLVRVSREGGICSLQRFLECVTQT